MKKTSLIGTFLLALTILATTPAAEAAGLVACDGITVQCNLCTLMQTLRNVFQWILVIAGILGAGVIMYGGFKMATSAGNESGYQDAKKYVYNAILGLLILMGAFTIVDVVLQTLVGNAQVGNLTAIWERASDCGGMSNTRIGDPEPIDEDNTELPEGGNGGEGGGAPAGPINMPTEQLPNGCQMSVQCMAAACVSQFQGVWVDGQCMPSQNPTSGGSDPVVEGSGNEPVGCQGVIIQGVCYGEVITNATTQTSCDSYGGFFSNGVCYRAVGGEDPTDPPVEPPPTNQSWTELCQFSCDDEVARCGTEGGIPEIISPTFGLDRVSCVISSIDGAQ